LSLASATDVSAEELRLACSNHIATLLVTTSFHILYTSTYPPKTSPITAIMKFLSIAVSTLLATSVAARRSGSAPRSSPAIAPLDTTTKVPGDNPLQHCQDPKDDILEISNVDLSPNPPKAYVPNRKPAA